MIRRVSTRSGVYFGLATLGKPRDNTQQEALSRDRPLILEHFDYDSNQWMSGFRQREAPPG